MSFEALAWAWKQKTGNPGRKAVLSALAQFADELGYCFPSQEHIAEYTEQSARTVREHLAWLEENNYLRRKSRKRQDGTVTTDAIYLNLDKPAAIFATGRQAKIQRQFSPAAEIADGEKPHNPAAKISEQEPVTKTPEPSGSNPSGVGARDVRTPKPPSIDFDFENGQWLNVSDAQRTLWAVACPAIDLTVCLAQAAAWLIANPANRKSNYLRFLTNWLKREQDKAPRVAGRQAINQSSTMVDGKPWFLSWTGIVAKAEEFNLKQGRDELPQVFKNRVYKAAGLTEAEYRKGLADFGGKAA